MLRNGILLGSVIVLLVGSTASAQPGTSARYPVHPITGYSLSQQSASGYPAPSGQPVYSPVSSRQMAPTRTAGWTNSVMSGGSCTGQPCASGDCGSSCAEGCTAEDCCGDSCLFGNTPVLSCLRNQKSCFCDDLTYSIGGEFRYRYMDEQNRLRPGVPATGARTNYDLWRFTPYVSMNWNDTVGGYIQGIDASAFGYDAPLFPVGIDVNRADLLRFYAELNMGDVGGGSLKYRYGRQFLKYGSQHLLSPLAWANTYRNFQGHKVLWQSGDWSIDGFHMASVNAAALGSGFSPTARDRADNDRTVSGVYMTYNGVENNTTDLYWMWSKERNRSTSLHDGNRHTFGARLAGKQPVKECNSVVGMWDWDIEGAIQIGEDDFTAVLPGGLNQDVLAGFFSAIGGYTFSNAPWSPSIGGIFYYGSGDSDPTDGEINTIYTLYPLAHAYWGLIDNFSGQNLIDYGLQASVKPAKKLTFVAACHWFDRATANDAVYNIVGAPLGAGSSATDIGNEVDLVATYKHSETLAVQAGYFWFWYGGAISQSAQARPDASQFYLQTTWTF